MTQHPPDIPGDDERHPAAARSGADSAEGAWAVHHGRRQLDVVAASDFVVWAGGGAIFPYLPLFLQQEADASLWWIGVIAGAYFVGVFAVSPAAGRLSDRVGRKPLLVGGTLLYAVSTLLFITTTEPALFVLFRLLEGAGVAPVVPAGQAFVAEITTDRNRSQAYGWWTTAQFGGLLIGPALAWPLYELGGGQGLWAFYTIFLVGSALSLLAAVALALFIREPA
ncbi:MAG: MFS transporter, partial [Thermoleophilia bacterium]|nr:MFS transporter [Thermoleophilia bacterium]